MLRDDDSNRDPLSKEPGAHPVGTGVGALGGAAAGAAVGALGGPLGAVVGGVAGAVAGGLGGKAAAEAVNPTAEEAYWKENYNQEPYYEAGRSFDDYAPAYRLGVQGRSGYMGSFEEVDQRLAADWEAKKERSTLSWPQARSASRAAWDRVATPSSDSPSGYNSSLPDMGSADVMGARQDDLDDDEVVDTLNGLLEACRDGEYGYRECAEHTKAQDIKMVLLRHADECRAAGVELQTLIVQMGGDADEGGSMSGALHRGWVSVRGTLMGHSDLAMLEECERGEDAAVARYRKALKQELPMSVKGVVERQAQGAQRSHDQIKALRDSLKAAN